MRNSTTGTPRVKGCDQNAIREKEYPHIYPIGGKFAVDFAARGWQHELADYWALLLPGILKMSLGSGDNRRSAKTYDLRL
jgi:hypothetical protein